MVCSIFRSVCALFGSLLVTNILYAAEIDASRTSGYAPLAVHFRNDGPFDHDYELSTGDGHRERGFVAGHIYEKPGVYTARLKETDPDTGALVEITEVQITVQPAPAQRYFVSTSGNDANSGTSPSEPWASVERVQQHLQSNKQNLQILFRRGDEFHLTGTNGISTSNLQSVRFGAYANPDGSDDRSLPRPVIHDREGTECAPGYAGYMIFLSGSHDVSISDIRFQGKYELVYGDTVCDASNGYKTNGLVFHYSDHIAINRVEIAKVKMGIMSQTYGGNPYPTNLFIHNSVVRNVNSNALYGTIDRVSIKDSEARDTGGGHLTYLWLEDTAVVRSIFSGSSINQPNNWYGCAFRANDTKGKMYVANNTFENAAIAPFCITNVDDRAIATEVIIESNIFDGSTSPDLPNYSYWDILELPVRKGYVRNNLFKHPRGPIRVKGRSTDDPIYDVTIEHNTFITDESLGGRAVVDVDGEYITENVEIKNNIMHGPSGPTIRLLNGAENIPGLAIDGNLIHRTNGDPFFVIGTMYSPASYSIAQWQAEGFDIQSLFQTSPQFISLDENSIHFARLQASSPAIDAGLGTGPFRDYYGLLRMDLQQADLGAMEFIPSPTLSMQPTNPAPGELVTFVVNASPKQVGRNVNILASESGMSPALEIPFHNGMLSLNLVPDGAFARSFNRLSGVINSDGKFTVQTTLESILQYPAVSSPFQAGVYDGRTFDADGVTEPQFISHGQQ